jgi:hypothetical protein
MRFRIRNKRKLFVVRWSALSAAAGLAISAIVAVAGREDRLVVPAAQSNIEGLTNVLSRQTESSATPIRFIDVTNEVGIEFRHFPSQRASLLPEDMGSGVACGDYDDDGYSDLFFVNFAGSVADGAAVDHRHGRCRLYRNASGARFEDVTDASGIEFIGYGMGAAWADYDNDGHLDLYITAFGNNALYRNLGDGTFKDVTATARVGDSRFSAGCSWADYDRDGDLDLYVCNYVDFSHDDSDRAATQRRHPGEQPFTLNPSSYAPQPNSLFRNNGDGTFSEVADATGVADGNGRSLSASWVDLSNDGWPDLYVANDVSKNGVFRNRADGTFEDVGAPSGGADYRGAMGIAVADVDHDLDQDLFITHWVAQENALYLNMLNLSLKDHGKDILFIERAAYFRLGQVSLDMVGWATAFCDFDNDARRDLWVINGSTLEDSADQRRLLPQRPLIFWRSGTGQFFDVTDQVGQDIGTPFVGRGGAQIDYNLDGRIDLVFVVHGGSPILLRNVSSASGNWIRLVLKQTGANTLALGARALCTAGGVTQMAAIGASSSYLSQDEPVIHFGLGGSDSVDSLTIVWPDGAEDRYAEIAANQTFTLTHKGRYPVQPSDKSPPGLDNQAAHVP